VPAGNNSDLFTAGTWAVALLAAVSLTQSVPVRLVLAVPLVLFVTGHVLLRAVGLKPASLAAHCTYAVGASIGVCLVGGLVLNLVGGLTPLGWAGWFAVVTVALSWFAWRRGADQNQAFLLLGLHRFRLVHGAVIGGALLIGCSAYAIGMRGEALQKQFSYTQFWMVPAAPDAPDRLLIGIKSAEPASQLFDVDVTFDGHPAGLWRSVEVKPGATWLTTFGVAPGAGKPHKAEARLYRAGDNDIYRRVSVVVPGG
jgi:hypothetical protein